MKWMLGKAGLWVLAAIGSTGAAGQAPFQQEPGDRIMVESCTACHDFRPIHTQALDAGAWNATIAKMIELGAQVADEDRPVLVEYLVRYHGPLPDGPGKALVLDKCTLCHDLERVKHNPGSHQHWEELLMHMLNEGADLADEEFAVVLDYLAMHFR